MPKRATRTSTTTTSAKGKGKKKVVEEEEDSDVGATSPRSSSRRKQQQQPIAQTVVLDSDEDVAQPPLDSEEELPIKTSPLATPQHQSEKEEGDDEEVGMPSADNGFHRRGKSAAAFADERASQLPKHQKAGTPIKRKRDTVQEEEEEPEDDAKAKREKKEQKDEEEDDTPYTEEDNIRILLGTTLCSFWAQ